MPWQKAAIEVPDVLTVATMKGRIRLESADGSVFTVAKGRVFVLESREAVLVWAPASGEIARSVFDVEVSELNTRTKALHVVGTDGSVLAVDGQGCGCNFGAVGNAGPSDGPYRLVKVRAPEWHTHIR